MKHKVITENTAEFFQFLIEKKQPSFTVKDVEAFMPDATNSYVKKFVQALEERQLVFRLKKGLYIMMPYDTKREEFFPNWHLTGSILAGDRDYYIGYYSAMQLHDLTTQPSLVEQVVVNKQILKYNYINVS